MFFKANKAFVPSISYQNMHIGKKKSHKTRILILWHWLLDD
jgi:hypothetical protein